MLVKEISTGLCAIGRKSSVFFGSDFCDTSGITIGDLYTFDEQVNTVISEYVKVC